jgi:hypothetical protein
MVFIELSYELLSDSRALGCQEIEDDLLERFLGFGMVYGLVGSVGERHVLADFGDGLDFDAADGGVGIRVRFEVVEDSLYAPVVFGEPGFEVSGVERLWIH